MSYFNQVSINTDNASGDAFGRLRVANPETLFDSKQLFDNQPLFWDDQEVSGTGTTSSHSANTASTTIGVSATTAGKRIRQSYMCFNYQPGKSQWILITGVMNKTGGGTGITQIWGYGNDNNGIFFVNDGGTLKVRVRSYATGAAVDTDIAQSAWSKDHLDGEDNKDNPSGIDLNVSKDQIFAVDLEWLGVGRVRFGFVIDGKLYIAHEQNHANQISGVYMSTPNLPVRYEIENDGTGAASTLEHICCSVMSEGGSEDLGLPREDSTNNNTVTCSTAGTIYPICGIRLKTTYIGAVVKVLFASIQIQNQSKTGEWRIILNPTISAALTWTAVANSPIEFGLNTTPGTPSTLTAATGTKLAGGFAESTSGGGGKGGTSAEIVSSRYLGADIAGNVDELYLTWMPNGGTTNHSIEGCLTWREL